MLVVVIGRKAGDSDIAAGHAAHYSAHIILAKYGAHGAAASNFKCPGSLAYECAYVIIAADASKDMHIVDCHVSRAFGGKHAATVFHSIDNRRDSEILNHSIIEELREKPHLVILIFTSTLI